MLDPRDVRQQVENLKIVHPELLEDDESWLASLESETDFTDLLTNIVERIDDTKAMVVGTKDRFEELKARKDRFEHRIEMLRGLLFNLMQAADVAKVELPIATLSLRAGQQQLIGEPDPFFLPEHFRKTVVTADRTKIKEALKAGESVEGCELSNSPPSLSIRVK